MRASYQELTRQIATVIVGQEQVVRFLLTCIFSNGHALLVGVPGLAKTSLIHTLGKVLALDFRRIQFTPDLMPSDILGSETMDKDRNFHFNKGPIFSNIILADEINRTPPKTQSALLEAMQERMVTIAGEDYPLDSPFFVLATQNPIEQEGTYPLPEAQLDRFMMMINLTYPSHDAEVEIVKRTTSATSGDPQPVLTKEKILKYQQLLTRVPVVDNVVEYAVSLVQKSRPHSKESHQLSNEFIDWGAGPRASQFLIVGAKCNALFNGKYAPDIEDVKAVANPILGHRILLNFKAEAENMNQDQIIETLMQ